MAHFQYILPVLRKYVQRQDKDCPHCGNSNTLLVGTKGLILQLRMCVSCALCFRWPKDSVEENYDFYNHKYREGGITVDLPSPAKLKSMMASSFGNTGKDFKDRINLLKQYRDSGSLLDYGASWGYVAYQLQRAGYEVIGFEIDGRRAEYGHKCLNLHMISDVEKLLEMKETFDIILTSHVLEHLPDLKSIFTNFYTLLCAKGLLCIFVPNCTGIDRAEIFMKKKVMHLEKNMHLHLHMNFLKRIYRRMAFK